MPRSIDEVGKKYNKLFVESYVGTNKFRSALYQCICDCGNRVIVKGSSLRNGETKSCGCLQKEKASILIQKYNHSEKRKMQPSPNKTHGMSNTKLYKIWLNMKRRCYDSSHENFVYYGGQGITVCDEWKNDFESFRTWALNNGYSSSLTIDRINTNGNYEPENCRWVPFIDQIRNRKNTIFLTNNGTTKTLMEWCKDYKIPYKLAYARHKKGWTFSKIFQNN